MDQIHIIKRTPGFWRAEAGAGSHIKVACTAAIQVATKEKVEVSFNFNGVEIVAVEGDSPEKLEALFKNELDRQAREWQESEAGKKYAADQRLKLEKLQSSIDELLAEFDTVSGVQSKLVDWVGRFSELNDHTGLNFDNHALSEKLQAAGYEENAEVGKDSESILADKAKMARYIIGQAINNLRSGMPIHPICSKFAADYAKMAEQGAQKNKRRP